ncbi:PAS domain S-box protein, partial [bacterium]|nr:PAS domain S-box protein [bacterium]
IEIFATIVEFEGQRQIVGVGRDITERKRTEKALRESEERLDLAVTGANLGLWDWNIQTESDVFNRQWAEMFGYTLEEIEPTAHSWERLVHPDDMPHVMDAWNAHVEGRTPLYEAEYRMRCKTGDWKWILDSGKIVEWDEDGNPLRATGVNRDITDRKLAQEALAKHKEHLQEMVEARTGELAKANERLQQEIIEREQVEKALRVSEQRFRELADLLPQIVFEADLDGRIAFMNRSGYEMFGYRDESLQKLPSYLQLLVPEDRNRVKENLQQFLGGEKSGINEYTALRKDGSTFPTLSYSSVVFRDGIPVGVRGIGVDITERKQAETVLRETQQRFLELVNLLPQTVFETDLEGNFTFVNRFGFEFYGYAQEDVDKGVHAFQVIVPEDRERAQHNIRRILTGEPPAGNEYRSLRKDGTVLSVVIYSSPIIREGKPAGLRGVVIDITERKRAEQELLESKGMLSALLNATEDAVFLTDNKGDILIHNDNFARRFGKSSDKLVGRNCLNIIPPELAKKRKEIADEMLTSGKALDFEDERDGRILHMSCYPICDKQGHVEKIAVFSRDITERTHAKQELQESRDMLSALLNATDDAVFLADTEERLLALNEKFASRFGKRVDELIGTNVFDLLSPDLAKARRKMVDKINATGKALNFVDERDGRIFHTFCYPICNKQGQVEKSAIFSRDITEQRQAEKALKESEERFRAIFDNAMDGIILADPETKQFYTANRMTCKMLGYSLEEIKTLGIRDIHPKEALPDVLEIFKKQLHGELTLGKDMPMKRKDSSVYYTDINASPIVV